MIFEDSCQSRSWMDRSLHLANEKGLETARTVVPLQSLAIPIPQLEAVFFLAVLVSVTKRIVDSCFALSPHLRFNFSRKIAITMFFCKQSIRSVRTWNYSARRRSNSRKWWVCHWPSRRKYLLRPGPCQRSKSARVRDRNPWCVSPVCRFPPATLCSPGASRDIGNIGTLCTNWPGNQMKNNSLEFYFHLFIRKIDVKYLSYRLLNTKIEQRRKRSW